MNRLWPWAASLLLLLGTAVVLTGALVQGRPGSAVAAEPAATAAAPGPVSPAVQGQRRGAGQRPVPPATAPPSAFVPRSGPGSVRDESELLLRRRMVDEQIRQRGIDQPSVLAAMEQVPRHLFVPEAYRSQAYDDVPLPMGWGQTVYQPYIVALMTSLLDLGPDDKVLEIGTGSGYHTAVLSRVAGQVYSIEISKPIAERARDRLATLDYRNIDLRVGDGYEGWADKAPFDAVILTAAPPYLPQPLIDQLKVGGKMVAPVGEYFQDLRVITKTADGLETESVIPVRLLPMQGEVRDRGER